MEVVLSHAGSQGQTTLNSRKREPSMMGYCSEFPQQCQKVMEDYRWPGWSWGPSPVSGVLEEQGSLELGRKTETGDLGPGLQTFALCSLCMLTLQMPSRGSVTTEASELENETIARVRDTVTLGTLHIVWSLLRKRKKSVHKR